MVFDGLEISGRLAKIERDYRGIKARKSNLNIS
jgi:hypothetical protein